LAAGVTQRQQTPLTRSKSASHTHLAIEVLPGSCVVVSGGQMLHVPSPGAAL